jgi:hypothetical protein
VDTALFSGIARLATIRSYPIIAVAGLNVTPTGTHQKLHHQLQALFSGIARWSPVPEALLIINKSILLSALGRYQLSILQKARQAASALRAPEALI